MLASIRGVTKRPRVMAVAGQAWLGSVPTTEGCRRMLIRRLTTILPEMTLPDALETTRIPRVAGRTSGRMAVVTTRPCRTPHYTISDVGLIGRLGAAAGRRVAGAQRHALAG